jgi:1A family penicillin-binding protein
MHSSRRQSIQSLYRRQKLVVRGLILLIAAVTVGFIFSFAIFAWYAKDLPSPGKLSQGSGSSTVFYDRDDKILYEMYQDKNRLPVALNEISDYLIKGTIAIEDKNFYKHKGISEIGILRAAVNTVFKGRLEGGSTITQQLIKNVLLTSQRRMSRKIKEMILAFEVERRYTKNQILEMYLNEAPYGGTYYGVGTASMAYFGKKPKDLNLVESAILAGLPQNPPVYSPFIGKKDAWKGRTMDVLRRMREDGYITKEQEKSALKKLDTIKFKSPKVTINAPHFVFYIKDQIEKEYGSKLVDEGVKIKTSLSLEAQQIVEKIVQEEIEKLDGYNVGNGAVVVLDSKTGQILAMVGSYDFNNEKYGKFNAALGLRQPGSTVKPITYALALEKGYTPSTVLMDVSTVFPVQGNKDYIPVNYDGKFRGPIQLKFALGNSINIPAVKLLSMVGLRDFLQKAHDMGMKTLEPTTANMNRFGLSLTLGGGETTLLDLTAAFAVFAGGGIKKEVTVTTAIEDYKGKSIFKQGKISEKRVFSEEVAFLISHILSDNNARLEVFGPNSYLRIPGKTVAVKTGTTDDKRDNWAVGYTKGITVGVWVGNNDNSAMNPNIASGATGASPIFYRIMNELLRNNKFQDGIIDKPDKVKEVEIDSYLGGLPKDGYPTRKEYFIEGTEPKDISPFYKKLKISKSTGKLANPIEEKTGDYEEKEYIVFTEKDPVSTDGKNRWQEAIDAWMREQGDSKFHPPTEISDHSSDSVVVSIKNPSDKESLNSKDVEIKAKITSGPSIKNVKVYLNNSEVKTIDGDRDEINEIIHINEDGAYELKVVARNEKDQSGESTIKFGINKAWDYTTPTPTPTPTETP